jgi:DNA-binding response OmpR family regulator
VEVCRQLKSDRRLGTVPVLIFSEQNQMTRMTESYKAKADYYVVVGKDVDTLEKRAQAILMRQVYR